MQANPQGMDFPTYEAAALYLKAFCDRAKEEKNTSKSTEGTVKGRKFTFTLQENTNIPELSKEAFESLKSLGVGISLNFGDKKASIADGELVLYAKLSDREASQESMQFIMILGKHKVGATGKITRVRDAEIEKK